MHNFPPLFLRRRHRTQKIHRIISPQLHKQLPQHKNNQITLQLLLQIWKARILSTWIRALHDRHTIKLFKNNSYPWRGRSGNTATSRSQCARLRLRMIDNVNNKLKLREIFHKDKETYYLEEWFVANFRITSFHLHTVLSPKSIININFTTSELKWLHRQLFHSAPVKLFNLLRRTLQSKEYDNTLNILNDIYAQWDPCKRVSSALLCFRVSFVSNYARFNERIFMDIV